MTLFEKIFATLSADAAVRTALGTATGAIPAIYPVTAPQGAVVPYVVYFTVTSTPEPTQDDGSGVDEGLLQFSCFAPTYKQADAIRRAIRAALKNLRLDDGGALMIDGQRDLYEGEIKVQHCLLEVHAVYDALAT